MKFFKRNSNNASNDGVPDKKNNESKPNFQGRFVDGSFDVEESEKIEYVKNIDLQDCSGDSSSKANNEDAVDGFELDNDGETVGEKSKSGNVSSNKSISGDALPNLEEPDGEFSFFEHLTELRSRLIRIILALLVVFVVLFAFSKELYTWLALPLIKSLPEGNRMIATEVVSPVLIPIMVAFWTSFFVTLPYVIYQVWSFVSPGLYKKEKKFIFPLVGSSIALFYLGVFFTYFVVLPFLFRIINLMAPDGVAVATDMSNYLSFVLRLFAAFGFVFEVPVVVVFLYVTGIVGFNKLLGFTRYFVVLAFVISAVITPPDVVSQLMMAIPLIMLYVIGVITVYFLNK